MQLSRPEFKLDVINLSTWYHCLPTEMCHYVALLGLRSTVMSTSVCLSVHSHNSKTAQPKFGNFFVHVVCGHGSLLL